MGADPQGEARGRDATRHVRAQERPGRPSGTSSEEGSRRSLETLGHVRCEHAWHERSENVGQGHRIERNGRDRNGGADAARGAGAALVHDTFGKVYFGWRDMIYPRVFVPRVHSSLTVDVRGDRVAH